MAMDQLTTCKTCSKEVAKSASKCPHCGAKLKMGVFDKVLILLGVFFVMSFIYVILVMPVNIKSTSSSSSSTVITSTVITSNIAADLIAIPDKIIYYHQGKENIIQKGDVKFDNIIKMSKSRVGKVDMYKSAILKSDIETQKQTNDVVELVYSKNIEANFKPNVDNAFQYKFVYNSLFFPLSGNQNNWLIFLPIQSGPLGPLKSGDELLKYLNN